MVTPEEIIKLGAELKLQTSERIVQKTIEFYPEQIEKDPTGNHLLWIEQALIEAQIKNILVTNYNDSDEDLLIFNTSLSVEELSIFLEKVNISYEDIYIVEDDEIQHYIYTPFFADAAYDQKVKNFN